MALDKNCDDVKLYSECQDGKLKAMIENHAETEREAIISVPTGAQLEEGDDDDGNGHKKILIRLPVAE